MKRLAVLSLCVLALGLAACGDRPQVVQYKQGVYQGKPFAQPYQAPPYSGDKTAWDKQMTQRAQAQNEYNRTK